MGEPGGNPRFTLDPDADGRGELRGSDQVVLVTLEPDLLCWPSSTPDPSREPVQAVGPSCVLTLRREPLELMGMAEERRRRCPKRWGRWFG
jgi:hypothetical protein